MQADSGNAESKANDIQGQSAKQTTWLEGQHLLTTNLPVAGSRMLRRTCAVRRASPRGTPPARPAAEQRMKHEIFAVNRGSSELRMCI